MPTKMVGHAASDSSQNTRQQRNLAEKQRRDKLNSYINELANIVPLVSMSSKRLDKTSILRLSAAFLRIHNSSLNSSKRTSSGWKSHFLNSENLRELLEAVDGFLIIINGVGKIVYVSQSVERFLGHQHIEMIGHCIYSFVHPSDLDLVQHHFQSLALSLSHSGGSKKNYKKCSFFCRLREHHQPRSEVITYQLVHFTGHMSYSPASQATNSDENYIFQQSDLMLKAFVRVVQSNPYTELSLSDAFQDEYVTRHNLDGTIIFADHRLSTVTGHLPHEVCGVSAYEYILKDDVPTTLFAHKLMFANNAGSGLIVYRLRTKSDGFVYLRSTGYLQYDKTTGQVEQFVCINHLMCEEEGEEERRKFMERFTPHINNSSSPATLHKTLQVVQKMGVKALENGDDKEGVDDMSMIASDEDLGTNGSLHVTRYSTKNFRNGNYHAMPQETEVCPVDSTTSYHEESAGLREHHHRLSSDGCVDNVSSSYGYCGTSDRTEGVTPSPDEECFTMKQNAIPCQETSFLHDDRMPQESTSDVKRVVSSAMNSLILHNSYDDSSSMSLPEWSDVMAETSTAQVGCNTNAAENSTSMAHPASESTSYSSSTFHLTDLSGSVVPSGSLEPLLNRCQMGIQQPSGPLPLEDNLLFVGNEVASKSSADLRVLPSGQSDVSDSLLRQSAFVQDQQSAESTNQYFGEGVSSSIQDHLVSGMGPSTIPVSSGAHLHHSTGCSTKSGTEQHSSKLREQ